MKFKMKQMKLRNEKKKIKHKDLQFQKIHLKIYLKYRYHFRQFETLRY